jgi:alkylation response protein AidB-like acyl-CoA dehydrogenase
METVGRLPADLAGVFAESGLFRQLVPRSLGGGEAHPRRLVESIEQISAANGSAGWCVMIAATTAAMSGWLQPEPAAEVFGDPLGVWGGAYAPLGRATRDGDRWRLTGSWPWGSGSQNCSWMAGGAVCDDGVFRLLYVPRADVTIVDNWDVVGLRGTGSHDWSVTDALVPAERSVDLLGGSPVENGPLYQFPLFGLLALGIAAVSLGLGAAALDALAELAGAKTPSLQRRKLSERGTVQAEVARSTARLRAARAYVFEAIDEAWVSAVEGHPPTLEQRANLRLAATHAAHSVVEVVGSAYTLGGGTSVRNDSPLARILRDAHVVTQHLMVSPVTYEPVGRVLLGLPVELLDL